MVQVILWVLVAVIFLVAVDRSLLWAESRGWLYYRRNKPRGGASVYHLLEMSAILDPTFNEVIEMKVQEEKQEDESGDPPAAPGGATGPEATTAMDP